MAYQDLSVPLFPRPGLLPLVQVPYTHPRQGVMRASEIRYWTFSCSGVDGVNLADAFEGRRQDLDGPEDVLLSDDFRKATIIIHVRPFLADLSPPSR